MTRSLRKIAVLAAAAAVLAGCAQSPGTAAVVNGERISERDLVDAGQTIAAVFQQEESSAVVLNMLINEPIFTAVGKDHGIEITDQALQEYVTSVIEAEVSDEDFTPAGLDLLRVVWVSSQMQGNEDRDAISAELVEAWQTAEVVVNPRYGEFNEQGGLVPIERPWIAASPAQ